jgi:hypothetical protein
MSAPSMRAKMVVSGVCQSLMNSSDPNSAVLGENLEFRAVCKSDGYPADGSDENNSFARWTPSANLSMYVSNPDLLGKYKAGDTFYVDFTPVQA